MLAPRVGDERRNCLPGFTPELVSLCFIGECLGMNSDRDAQCQCDEDRLSCGRHRCSFASNGWWFRNGLTEAYSDPKCRVASKCFGSRLINGIIGKVGVSAATFPTRRLTGSWRTF